MYITSYYNLFLECFSLKFFKILLNTYMYIICVHTGNECMQKLFTATHYNDITLEVFQTFDKIEKVYFKVLYI